MASASKLVGAGLATFIGVVFVVQIWAEYRRDVTAKAYTEAETAAQAARAAKWEADHPAEAAALNAKMQRAEARRERMFRDVAACSERPTAETYQACLQEARRRDALECLQGQDWRACEAINQ